MEDLALALTLADQADEITSRYFQSSALTSRSKPDRSLVTVADTETETALRSLLAQHRPHDNVLGEEGGATTASKGNRRWIIDPLDHTNNYVRGIPFYATLISLQENGEVTVGVVSAPALNRRWWAKRDNGAFADGEPIETSQVSVINEAWVSFAALHRWNQRGLLPGLAELTETARYTWGSGGWWAQMMVAEGRFDAALDPWGKPWDIAATQVIVEEAGGRVTDLSGERAIDHDCAIVTNGLLHDEVLAKLHNGSVNASRPAERE